MRASFYVLAGIFIGILLLLSLPVFAQTDPHANCQYPNRLSNPPNGCDNTDPARPECMKGGTEDCTIPTPAAIVVPEPPAKEPETTYCK